VFLVFSVLSLSALLSSACDSLGQVCAFKSCCNPYKCTYDAQTRQSVGYFSKYALAAFLTGIYSSAFALKKVKNAGQPEAESVATRGVVRSLNVKAV
jgi:hypothetical protein